MRIPEDLIYYKGKMLKIVFAKRSADKCPAREFLDSLDPLNWSKLDRVLKRLGDFGKICNIEKFRVIDGPIYEVKGGALRLAGFFIPGHFVLTNGFKKRGGGKAANKFPKEELNKARTIMKEFRY